MADSPCGEGQASPLRGNVSGKPGQRRDRERREGFRVPDRLVKRIVFMHVGILSLILSAPRSLIPIRGELPPVSLQAAFFRPVSKNLKDRMRYFRPGRTKPFVHRNS